MDEASQHNQPLVELQQIDGKVQFDTSAPGVPEPRSRFTAVELHSKDDRAPPSISFPITFPWDGNPHPPSG
jgi:hypothetical protein